MPCAERTTYLECRRNPIDPASFERLPCNESAEENACECDWDSISIVRGERGNPDYDECQYMNEDEGHISLTAEAVNLKCTANENDMLFCSPLPCDERMRADWCEDFGAVDADCVWVA